MNPGFRITNSNFLSNRDFNILAAVLELKKNTLLGASYTVRMYN